MTKIFTFQITQTSSGDVAIRASNLADAQAKLRHMEESGESPDYNFDVGEFDTVIDYESGKEEENPSEASAHKWTTAEKVAEQNEAKLEELE